VGTQLPDQGRDLGWEDTARAAPGKQQTHFNRLERCYFRNRAKRGPSFDVSLKVISRATLPEILTHSKVPCLKRG
jgi:hypothetical protein